jgi:hypothetical protein
MRIPKKVARLEARLLLLQALDSRICRGIEGNLQDEPDMSPAMKKAVLAAMEEEFVKLREQWLSLKPAQGGSHES